MTKFEGDPTLLIEENPVLNSMKDIVVDGIATELSLAKIILRKKLIKNPDDSELEDSLHAVVVIEYDSVNNKFFRYEGEEYGLEGQQNTKRDPKNGHEIHVTQVGRILKEIVERTL